MYYINDNNDDLITMIKFYPCNGYYYSCIIIIIYSLCYLDPPTCFTLESLYLQGQQPSLDCL